MNKDNRSPAQVMADFVPQTIIIAKTPPFQTSVYSEPPDPALPYETMELRSIDIIHAFLNLQRQALDEAAKRKKYSAFNKIRKMVTFDSRKNRR